MSSLFLTKCETSLLQIDSRRGKAQRLRDGGKFVSELLFFVHRREESNRGFPNGGPADLPFLIFRKSRQSDVRVHANGLPRMAIRITLSHRKRYRTRVRITLMTMEVMMGK